MEDTRSQLITKTITKEEINDLPLVKFEGPIHVIPATGADMAAVVSELKKHPVLGFDTETRPSFKKGVSYPPALIQFSSEDEAWLIRLNGDPLDPALIELFEDPSILKVGVALHDDIKHLQEVTDFDAKGFIDVASLAYDHGIKKRGLRNMTGIFLEFRLSKSAQLSNWAQDTLTPAQLSYAATDAWVSLHLYNKFCELGLNEAPASEA